MATIRPLCALLVAAALLPAVGARAAALPARQPIAITDVTVVDVARDRSFGPRTVLVADGRIMAIVAPGAARIPAHARRVDGRGRFLIPGLVDMHVHLFNLSSHRPPNDWAFPLFVANGVTSVREMRGDATTMPLVRQWRAQLEAGTLVAPRIAAAGIAVDGATPDAARQRVDAAADAGADFIKVFSEVAEPQWRAILVAARRRGLPVAGHVPAGVRLLDSARAGQRSAEHLMQAYEACSTQEDALLAARHDIAGDALAARRDAQERAALEAFDARTCRRVATRLAATAQVQVPTLALSLEDVIARDGSPDADPRWRALRPDERLRWQRFLASYTADDAALARLRWPVARRIVAILHRAGVTVLAGTDTPMPGVYPGSSLHDEMGLLVAAGLTPRAALRAATLSPARYLGIDATSGSVAVGKRADLVLLDADPARDIRNTRRIDAVLLDGRLLRRADLDALLDEAARASSN